jgi:hypothetical protein
MLDKHIGTRTQVFDDANVTFSGPAGYAGRISPGVYEYARDAGSIGTVNFGGLVSGRSYIVSVQISAYAGSVPGIVSLRADFFDGAVTPRPFVSAAGTYTFYFVATVSGSFTIRSGAPLSGGTISNVSILEVPGNHATQATVAQRPTYGIVPATGRRNLLTRTEEFDNAVWVKTNTSVVANNATAPNGTLTADTVTSNAVNSLIVQSYVFAATTYRFSIWLRRVSGTGVVEGTLNNFAYTQFSLTSTWQRFSFSHTTIAGNNAFQIRFGSSGDVVEMWGAQLETGSTATNYQRVGTAFDVTEAGVASMSYLSFDGTDDSLSTGNIVPGTDKAQVFAGLRKLSDAAVGTVVELSNSIASNTGSFNLQAPGNTSGVYYNVASRGSAANAANQRSDFTSTGAAPDTVVLTSTHDIAGDLTTFRRNGVVGPNATGDKGTGNFLTYPIYIGRRGGTTFPLNGQIYGLIVRFGPNLDTATITQTETWMGQRIAQLVSI